MEKYKELAERIIKAVGGKENINALTNCFTRLRFSLKDEGKANTDTLKNMDGVVTVVQAGGQYQVVIGNHVADVCKAIEKVTGTLSSSREEAFKGNLFDRFVDIISGIFQPILAPLCAAGMLKGLNAVLAYALGPGFVASSTYAVFNAMGDGLFLFLPIFIGYSAMKKFGGSPFLGMMIASSLVYTGFLDGSAAATFAESGGLSFFGIPFSIPPAGYGSTVMPIIASTAFAAFLEKQWNKIIPDVAKIFLVPFFTALITFPLTMLIIGPVMNIVSDGLGQLLLTIQDFSPIIFGAILGFTWQILVMFGMHWALIPFVIFFVSQGIPTALLTGVGSVSFAQTGAVLAVMLKTKNKRLKELTVPAFISGLFGITEPAIYGITLPKKKPFWASCAIGAITGAIAMGLGVQQYAMGGLGIFRYTALISPAGDMSFAIYSVILDVSALIGTFALAWVIGFKDDEAVTQLSAEEAKLAATNRSKKHDKEDVFSPLNGNVLPLSQAKDPAFAEEMMGKGVVIEPSDGMVLAPFDGTILSLFPTKHAIGLISDKGTEILIHIGIDTVNLNGEGFESFVERNAVVKKGDKLVAFDIKGIQEKGYSTQVPVIVTNTPDYTEVIQTPKNEVKQGEVLITTVS